MIRLFHPRRRMALLRTSRRHGLAGLAALVMVAAGPLATPAAAQDMTGFAVTAFKQAVAERLSEDADVAAFYRSRDFAPLWTGAGDDHRARRAALFEALASAGDHGLPAARYDAEGLLHMMSRAATETDRGAVEMALTRTYLRFARDLQSGLLDPSAVDSDIKRDRPVRPADALLAALETGDPRAAFRALPPQTAEYTRLMRTRLMLEHRIARGGWGAPVRAGKLEPGDRGASVVALRDRLIAMGYLDPHPGTAYDAAMTAAVREFQTDHGLLSDGVAGGSTLRALNVPPEERLESVLVAMERERWLNLPEGRGDRHVLVNLVDFHAQIIDHDKVTFRTRSVIGHQDPDRQSPEFSDTMEHMVINPYWHVPRSIIVGEYLPQLRANPGALSHLQITDARGRVVSRAQDFSRYTARTFPFNMRQVPGPRNALGSVKFMFPNRHNIYLHDTPAQNLFSREVRTYSHGCVRLADPHDFAYALLAPQVADPEPYFQRILNSGARTQVDLETQIPVHLIYRTAFTQAKGRVQYRDDVYGRDARIWAALSREGVAPRRADG